MSDAISLVVNDTASVADVVTDSEHALPLLPKYARTKGYRLATRDDLEGIATLVGRLIERIEEGCCRLKCDDGTDDDQTLMLVRAIDKRLTACRNEEGK